MAEPYFASVPPEQLGASIAAKLEDIANDRDFHDADKALAHLYGGNLSIGDGSAVRKKGEDSQLLDVNVKKAKALLESLVGLVLGPPITWKVSARNADAESRGAVLLGSNLMEFFWKEDGFGVFCQEWAKAAYALKEAYAFPDWYMGQGAAGFPDGARLLMAGGLRTRLIQKWDVFFDLEYRSFEECPWVCVRTWENKYDLAALAEGEGEALAALQADIVACDGGDFLKARKLSRATRRDVVPVYTLFHRPTPSVPQGLEVRLLNAKTVLSAKTCEEIPVVRMTPSAQIDSALGDSQWTGVLGIEELTDAVESALASNYNAFGTQAVAMDSRTVISRDRVNNLAVMELPPGVNASQAVQGVQLTSQPQGADKWLSQKASDMAFVTGQNDVQLGQPDTAQMNARAFAILKSAAAERNSGGQRRVFDAIGKLGAVILRILSRNMTEEQALALGGRAARLSYPVKKWTGADLAPIATCFVEVGNALEQTSAGRLEIATMLLELDAIKTPEDLAQVVETGRLEQAINVQREESLLISWEHDEILEGRTPVVHWAQNHINHATKHACLASQPAALADERAMVALQQHLDWHYREFYALPEGVEPKADPQYLDRMRVLLGQPAPSMVGPPPMGAMSGTPPPAAGASSTTPPPGAGAPPPPGEAPAALSPPQPGAEVEQPEGPPTVLQ